MPLVFKFSIVLPLFLAARLYAQPPAIEWQKTFDGGGLQAANNVCAGNGGGYVMAVVSSGTPDAVFPNNHGLEDCWIIKTNDSGNIIWKVATGGSGVDVPKAVAAVKGGGYVVAGYTSSTDFDVIGKHGRDITTDYWLIRLDENGKILWQKCYGGSDFDYAYSVDVTNDGGFVLAGMAVSDDGDVTQQHGNGDYWIVRLDAGGNILWQKSIGGINPDEANSIRSVADGSFVVLGFSFSGDGDVAVNNRSGNVWLVKISSTGVLQWQRSFGGDLPDYGQTLILTKDGGYFIGGYSYSATYGNHGSADYYGIKLNSDASLAWQFCFGGTSPDILTSAAETPDGGFILAGNSISTDGDASGNHGLGDALLVKLDKNGSLNWSASIGGSKNDQLFGIINTADDGLLFVGSTESGDGDLEGFHPLASGVWMAKLGCIPVLPTIRIQTTTAKICSGDNVSFTASVANAGGSPAYQWKKNQIDVGSNSVTYQDNNLQKGDSIYCLLTSDINCALQKMVSSDTIVVNISDRFTAAVSISTQSSNICKGSQALFSTPYNSADSNALFTWFVNNNPIANSNNDTIIISTLTDGDHVSLQIQSHEPCAVSTPVTSNILTMKVVDAAVNTVNITTPGAQICEGDNIQFTAVSSATNGNFQWQVNNEFRGNNLPVFSTHEIKNGDEVVCVFSSDNGCLNRVVSNIIPVSVYEKPVVICMNDSAVTQGALVTLYAQVNGNYSSSSWSSTETIQNTNSINNALVMPKNTANYILTVTGNEGCSAFDEVTITVIRKNIIPNAFSPNSDGVNDVWQLPAVVDCKECFVNVFDRYGALVYSSKTFLNYWDGKRNGIPVPVGVYYYYIKTSPGKKPETGSVTILR